MRQTFPYSRHSSYNELCMLIEAFTPLDIYPCTVDEANWSAACSMETLFEHCYPSGCSLVGAHDEFMRRKRGHHQSTGRNQPRPVSPASSVVSSEDPISIAGSSDIRPRAKSMASKRVATDSKESLNHRIWSSLPTKLDHDRSDEISRLGRSALLRTALRQRSQPLRTTPSKVSTDDSDEAPHRTATVTATCFDSSSPTPVGRSQMQLVPTWQSRNSPNLDAKRSRVPSSDILEDWNRRDFGVTEGVVPESDPPTPIPKKRVKLDPLAFRSEVADAVRSYDGRQWAQIGLVSVKGHQEREMEL